MRHSSIKTTARYLHTDAATLREKQRMYPGFLRWDVGEIGYPLR
jgi:hypothetical protein